MNMKIGAGKLPLSRSRYAGAFGAIAVLVAVALTAFLALRALQMSWLLTYERIIQALFHSRGSLAYKSG